tara:strand:- start:46 stop:198 length:153 start_codon:yes stop_codon:yes gene_type:complete
MKAGERVHHPRLGDGIILELRKYGGAMVDFSDSSGVLVRIVKLCDLEEIK